VAAGRRLLDLARGVDSRQVDPDSAAKSLSVEETYDRDLRDRDVVETAIMSLAQRLSIRLRRAGVSTLSVGIKVRHDDFTTFTRSKTLARAIDSYLDLYKTGLGLTEGVDLDRPIRLLGLAASSLVSAGDPVQLALGEDAAREPLETAVASIRDRFGAGAVGPARLLRGSDQPEDRQGG
ncbi:MAG: DNA polymerase IV, partial [Acidimicrobiia bacterium]|nr:DNA polymerase IV [Acidimicrobiia bacterium]